MPFTKGHKFGKRFKKSSIPWNKGLIGFRKGYKQSKEQIEKRMSKKIGTHHTLESGQKMSKARMGRIPWNKGLEYTEELKAKLDTDGLRPGWNKGLKGFRAGYKQSDEHKGKIRDAQRGENNYKWNPNREEVMGNKRDNTNAEYHLWARNIKRRDNWKCKISNEECSGRLEAHHILPWSKFPELRYELNNGITLCHKHHPKSRDAEIKLAPSFQKMLLTTVNQNSKLYA